jgi:hypothetical protein
MTTSKKTTQPKPDITAVAQTGETQAESLPAATGIDAPDVTEPASEPRYRITARHPNGFWRCGRKWHPDGEVLTLSEIGGEAVLAALQAEPMLVVAVEA